MEAFAAASSSAPTQLNAPNKADRVGSLSVRYGRSSSPLSLLKGERIKVRGSYLRASTELKLFLTRPLSLAKGEAT